MIQTYKDALRIVARISAVALVAALVRPTYGEFRPATINIDDLLSQVQTAVLGQITSVRVISEDRLPGSYGAMVTSEKIDVRIEHCYKPPDGCAATLSFVRSKPETDFVQPELSAGYTVMAFLRDSGGMLSPPNGWSIWRVEWLKRASAAARNLSGEDLLETDLASGLDSNDPGLRLESMHYLQGFHHFTSDVETRLRSIADNQATPLEERLKALATLLLVDPKPEHVELVAKMAQTHAQAISLYFNAARDVGGGLQWVKAPEALPSLIAIFESKVEGWHAPAMYAIRVIQDAKTVPLLIKALDDPDPEAEYHALFALTQITHKGGDFGPGIVTFERDPSKYVQLWKHWWETEGEARYGSF